MRLLVSNGEEYEGDVKELQGRHLKHGKGQLSHKGSVYNGDWVMDMKDGHGFQMYANGTLIVALLNLHRIALPSITGDVYEGAMKKNVRHGTGTLKLKSGEM